MYKHIFETHAHYDDPCYADHLDSILKEQEKKGVEFIINSS
jgi:hypothetical protein